MSPEEEKEDREFREGQQIYRDILGSVYDETDFGLLLFDGSDVFKNMERIFNDAQEKVCINGKEALVYRDFDHWLEIKKQEIAGRDNSNE